MGALLGASGVTSEGTCVMRALRCCEGYARVSIQRAGRVGSWLIHPGPDVPCLDMANASSHPWLRHLDLLLSADLNPQ